MPSNRKVWGQKKCDIYLMPDMFGSKKHVNKITHFFHEECIWQKNNIFTKVFLQFYTSIYRGVPAGRLRLGLRAGAASFIVSLSSAIDTDFVESKLCNKTIS